ACCHPDSTGTGKSWLPFRPEIDPSEIARPRHIRSQSIRPPLGFLFRPQAPALARSRFPTDRFPRPIAHPSLDCRSTLLLRSPPNRAEFSNDPQLRQTLRCDPSARNPAVLPRSRRLPAHSSLDSISPPRKNRLRQVSRLLR